MVAPRASRRPTTNRYAPISAQPTANSTSQPATASRANRNASSASSEMPTPGPFSTEFGEDGHRVGERDEAVGRRDDVTLVASRATSRSSPGPGTGAGAAGPPDRSRVRGRARGCVFTIGIVTPIASRSWNMLSATPSAMPDDRSTAACASSRLASIRRTPSDICRIVVLGLLHRVDQGCALLLDRLRELADPLQRAGLWPRQRPRRSRSRSIRRATSADAEQLNSTATAAGCAQGPLVPSPASPARSDCRDQALRSVRRSARTVSRNSTSADRDQTR